jgi:hypothetical protein
MLLPDPYRLQMLLPLFRVLLHPLIADGISLCAYPMSVPTPQIIAARAALRCLYNQGNGRP